ncbi:MAG: hypothetical protein ACE5R6_19950 [Candidatus Heimdallarchaeota archaeon]
MYRVQKNQLRRLTKLEYRLYFFGLDKEKQDDLRGELIQESQTYLDEMVKVGKELKRVLKPGSLIVYVHGDVHQTKFSINTTKEVSQIYQDKLGFEETSIVNDEIPLNKVASRTKKKKFDRILVIRNKEA